MQSCTRHYKAPATSYNTALILARRKRTWRDPAALYRDVLQLQDAEGLPGSFSEPLVKYGISCYKITG